LGPCIGIGTCIAPIGGAITVPATFAPASIGIRIPDIDANNQYDALTDGLLVIRDLFGLSGAGLVEAAIGSGALRTSDTQVQNYLATLKP